MTGVEDPVATEIPAPPDTFVTVPAEADDQDSTLDPLVARTCPADPSVAGRVQILLLAILSGALNPT